MVKTTNETCHNITKTKNNYNIAALILRSICLLALFPLGSDPPGFLCIYKVVILFLCFIVWGFF